MNQEEEKRKATEKAEWRVKMYEQCRQELALNPGFVEIAKEYNTPSVDEFINEYAREKVYWMEWGPSYKEWQEKEDLQWVNDAFERLQEIQQKKLFDKQCLWRADKIKLEGVELCFDFHYWEYRILNCPFIEPVNEDDIQMYMQYLQSSNWQEDEWGGWQRYEEIKEAYNSENANRNFPDWYDFHNGRTGGSIYLSLPDVRGELELFYRKIHAEATKEEREKEQKKFLDDPNREKRPYLNHHGHDFIEWFVDTFEDKETQQKFQNYGGIRGFDQEKYNLEGDIDLLAEALVPLPVDAWFDWREAIHRSADKFRRQKIAEAMPAAFDQYKMRISMGLPFEDNGSIENWDYMRSLYLKPVIEGRILNGEPGDLNF